MSCIPFWKHKRSKANDHQSNTSSALVKKIEQSPTEVVDGQTLGCNSKTGTLSTEEEQPSRSIGGSTVLGSEIECLEYSSKRSNEDTFVPGYRTTPESAIGPPTYNAYEYSYDHPDFPKSAIVVALRASHPPRSSFEDDRDKFERQEAEEEQSQYLRSIKYGDQVNRGLGELDRFREEQLDELQESSGLTAEEIERRRRLNDWDDSERW